jgi:IclR family KDG regulon transcriptional repressor
LPQEEWESRISKDREKYTENTVCDLNLIIEELVRCKKQGFAIDNEEREIGFRCIGIPVFNMSNQLVGGMSIVADVNIMNDEKLTTFISLLQEGAYRSRERLYK